MGSLEDRKSHSDCEDTPNGLSSFDGHTQRHSDKDGDKQSDPETDRGIRLGDLGAALDFVADIYGRGDVFP